MIGSQPRSSAELRALAFSPRTEPPLYGEAPRAVTVRKHVDHEERESGY
jgi:hypothetical protein